ncbi:hypothetical protein ID866_3269 [Astraeus odoratus]|nr:hypothetical protein ID866_3269 [Astraeus odoratus]
MFGCSSALGSPGNDQAVFDTSEAPRQHKPASLPSENPTHSFWTHSSPDANPLAREGSEDPLTADADICIIGSGITGVGVAYHLSEAISNGAILDSPLSVVILEARDFCRGSLLHIIFYFLAISLGRNGGHLTAISFSGFSEREKEHGVDEALRSCALENYTVSAVVKLIEENDWSKDVDWVNGGHVSLLFPEGELERTRTDYERAKVAGLNLDDVYWLTQEKVEEVFGAHHPAVRKAGHNLWPLKFVTKLYEHARQRSGERFNLKLHTHTPVTSVSKLAQDDSDSSRKFILSTPRGTITCSRVVHATNAYASHLLPFLAGQDGIIPTRGQVIATRASVGTELIKTNTNLCDSSLWQLSQYWFPRPLKPGEQEPLIILGGAREASHEPFEQYVDDDSSVNPVVGKFLRDFLPSVFEGMFEYGKEPEMEWTGIMGYTAMGDPFVGPVFDLSTGNDKDYKGQYIAAGYTGHGMPRAFACAEVVVQMIVAELTGKEWSRLAWFPQRYLTWNRMKYRN